MPERSLRALVVDDDVETVELMTAILSTAGYEVLAAHTGADALMLLQLESPAVVLLDLQMPGMSGLDVLRRLRMVRPDVPVVVVSGQSDGEIARATLKRGAVDYIRKPAQPDHLLRTVAAALAGPRPDMSRLSL
jgi:CheY-like chemotaxis protein